LITKDDHFAEFAGVLEREIARTSVGEPDISFYEQQKGQVEELIARESAFREALIAHPRGVDVYHAFIRHICDNRKNILAARPYFRVRQETFTASISPALKGRNPEGMFPFAFNYLFVVFAMSQPWTEAAADRELVRMAHVITAVRTQLIVRNMPLAISRARIFWSRTPESHLSYMDFVQISCDGLMSGIDKFVPPFGKVFRDVVIGRIVGNFIEQYSETMLHFFPADKRRIYRAHKHIGRQPDGVDYDEVAEAVNTDVAVEKKTNASEISELVSAASCVSLDLGATTNSEHGYEGMLPSQLAVAPDDTRPDVRAETRSSTQKLVRAMNSLTLVERKLLRLSGLDL